MSHVMRGSTPTMSNGPTEQPVPTQTAEPGEEHSDRDERRVRAIVDILRRAVTTHPHRDEALRAAVLASFGDDDTSGWTHDAR